jgi:bacterioferritin-associated ferredoxin
MLVCQCNVITDREIEAVVRALLDEDRWAIIVPAMVYRALARQSKCAGCVPNIVDIIVRVTETVHAERAAEAGAAVPAPRRKLKSKRFGGRHERRGTGHRAA